MNAIAIIGIGCRFPGGVRDTASYWSLLREGRCAIAGIPPERWSLDGFYDPRPDRPDRSISRWGGFLDDIRGFDPDLFGLSNREAADMDPQQRLLLQVAREAMEGARLRRAALAGTSTGVFVGVSNADYASLQRYRHGEGDRQAGTGTALSIVANRLSNVFDLNGPSLCVDTACSSSLVALDAACKAIADGSCDLAFAGGVNILLDPRLFISFSRAHMLSPRGRIKAFGEGADGFVRGEGAGLVLLKRLVHALRDGDPVQAVIRSTAVNQDGATETITAPDEDAQAAMIARALERAGAEARDVAFVEAHGTGTALGDPTEASAIARVLCGDSRSRPLLLGSAKAAIGHLEPAAGIAGLIKAVLSLRHGECPPMANFDRPNPEIPFGDMNLAVPTCPERLPDRPLALVNAFGFGGTNACALLEAAPRRPARSASVREREAAAAPIAIPVSGVTPAHLQAYARTLCAELAPGGALSDMPISRLAAALGEQRDAHAHRATVIASDRAELPQALGRIAQGGDHPLQSGLPGHVTGHAHGQPRLVFTFTGQGGQYWNMGRGLLEGDRHFNEWLERFDRLFIPEAGWSVREALLAEEQDSRLSDPAVTPAVMFALQAGIADGMKRIGILPDLVIGHSFGEVTAAYVAGALPLEAVPRLVSHRGLIRRHVDRIGAMAAIAMGAGELSPYLPRDGSIEIGAYNSPAAVTVTGEAEAIDALLQRLEAGAPGVRTHRLDLDFAWHSSWLDPVERRFLDDVGETPCRTPRIPVISTVTGLPEAVFDSSYWWRNLRQPVRYDRAVRYALGTGASIFLEIGPHRTLSSLIGECAAAEGRDVTTVSALHRGEDDLRSVACAVARLWCAGIDVDWQAWTGEGGRDIALPSAPSLDRDFWDEPLEVEYILRAPAGHPLLGRRQDAPCPAWSSRISIGAFPWLADHRVAGSCLFPAAGYIEIFRAAAACILDTQSLELRDIRFHQPLELSAGGMVELRTEYVQDRRRLTLYARPDAAGSGWTPVAEARIAPLAGQMERISASGSAEGHWQTPYADGPQSLQGYGPRFRTLRSVTQTHEGLLARVVADEAVAGLGLDPCILDGCLQLAAFCRDEADGGDLLPHGIDRVRIAGALSGEMTARASVRATSKGRSGTIHFGRLGDEAVLSIEGFHARRIPSGAAAAPPAHGEAAFYRESFVPIEPTFTRTPAGQGKWLLLTSPGGRNGSGLRDALSAIGCEAVNVPLADGGSVSAENIAALLEAETSGSVVAGIVHACPLDRDCAEDADVADGFRSATWQTILLAQALDLAPCPDAPFIVLTKNARTAGDGMETGLPALEQAGLVAVTRTIALERQQRRVRCIDVDYDALRNPETIARLLVEETGETELVLRDERLFAPRLERTAVEALPPRRIPRRRLSGGQDFILRQSRTGVIGSLYWQQSLTGPLGPGEVHVQVEHAGLNFRDVMLATGALPPDAEQDRAVDELGMEFQGVVEEIAGGAERFSPGDRVFGLARGTLRRFLTLPEADLHAVPPDLGGAPAAGIPVAFLTAWHALVETARLQEGERVLVHNATGGVGLAAIAVARHLGTGILATAGSEEKRDYLRHLGIDHVFDSRSPGFAEAIRAVTGSGVDVVLNSLSGDLLREGIECLAPYGRFVELGKRDLYEDSALGLRSLRRNLSFHVVDLAAMMDDRPDCIRHMMRQLTGMFASGELQPLPVIVHGASTITSAFHDFARASHVGKLVIDMNDPAVEIAEDQPREWRPDANGTYLVTGGGRGFGFAVGRWLARQGAGRVVLASRAGVMEAGDRGDGIEAVALDVTDPAAVRRLVGDLVADARPLRGILHAAAVYDDAMIEKVTAENVARVAGPKVDGALALTRAVRECSADLDVFATFSSLSHVTGWPGQASYAASNGFLAALVRHQRSMGIPGQCINWGALAESGHVSRNRSLEEYLDQSGWTPLPVDTALDALSRCLRSDAVEITFAAADWQRLAARHPALGGAARLAALASGREEEGGSLRAASAVTGRQASQLVRTQLARVLGAGERDLDSYATLSDAGLDSLSSLELRNALELESGLHIPIGRFTRADTIGDLADLLCELSQEAHEADGGKPARDAESGDSPGSRAAE